MNWSKAVFFWIKRYLIYISLIKTWVFFNLRQSNFLGCFLQHFSELGLLFWGLKHQSWAWVLHHIADLRRRHNFSAYISFMHWLLFGVIEDSFVCFHLKFFDFTCGACFIIEFDNMIDNMHNLLLVRSDLVEKFDLNFLCIFHWFTFDYFLTIVFLKLH